MESRAFSHRPCWPGGMQDAGPEGASTELSWSTGSLGHELWDEEGRAQNLGAVGHGVRSRFMFK